jgi:hypothetical protein
MLIHQMLRAEALPSAVEMFDDLLGGLPAGFKRTLFPVRDQAREILGLASADDTEKWKENYKYNSAVIKGELIITESRIFSVEVFQSDESVSSRKTRGVEEAGTEKDIALVIDLDYFGADLWPEELKTLVDFINDVFSVTLKPYSYPSERMAALKAEGRPSPARLTAEEIKASQALSDRATRSLAISIRQAGGLLSDDLARQIPERERSRVDQIRKSLEESGITVSETVVICQKTGSQVVIVPNLADIKSLGATGLKCPCGTAVSDEKIGSALSISDEGRLLLDGNHWFTLLLIEQLLQFGVLLEDILVDQISGGDELDCIACVSGQVVLFELKAKEFNLGGLFRPSCKNADRLPLKSRW